VPAPFQLSLNFHAWGSVRPRLLGGGWCAYPAHAHHQPAHLGRLRRRGSICVHAVSDSNPVDPYIHEGACYSDQGGKGHNVMAG